jgi:tetratricopeptide (TPR) repeat protein
MTVDHSTSNTERSTWHEEPSAAQRHQPLVIRHWSLVILLGLALFALWVIWPKVVSSAWTNLGAMALSRATLQGAIGDVTADTASLEQALQVDGENAVAWRMLGRIWLSQGEHERAAQALQQAAMRMPTDGLTWYAWGLAFWRLKERTQAIQAWHQAMKSELGLLLWLGDNPEQGMKTTELDPEDYQVLIGEMAKSAIEGGSRDAWLYVTVAEYYRSLGDLQKAESWYIKGHHEGRGSFRWVPAAYLAGFLMGQERYAEARAWLEKAMARSPVFRPDYQYNIARTYEAEGRLHEAAGRLEEALAAYEKALEIAPDDEGYKAKVAEIRRVLIGQKGQQ